MHFYSSPFQLSASPSTTPLFNSGYNLQNVGRQQATIEYVIPLVPRSSSARTLEVRYSFLTRNGRAHGRTQHRYPQPHHGCKFKEAYDIHRDAKRSAPSLESLKSITLLHARSLKTLLKHDDPLTNDHIPFYPALDGVCANGPAARRVVEHLDDEAYTGYTSTLNIHSPLVDRYLETLQPTTQQLQPLFPHPRTVLLPSCHVGVSIY